MQKNKSAFSSKRLFDFTHVEVRRFHASVGKPWVLKSLNELHAFSMYCHGLSLIQDGSLHAVYFLYQPFSSDRICWICTHALSFICTIIPGFFILATQDSCTSSCCTHECCVRECRVSQSEIRDNKGEFAVNSTERPQLVGQGITFQIDFKVHVAIAVPRVLMQYF